MNLRSWTPKADDKQRRAFFDWFSWGNSQLTHEEQAMVERLLVEYHHIFARHQLDMGINNDFEIKLTPKHDQPVYAQSLPTPTNLTDEILVELALQQAYVIITNLPFRMYSSPILAQREPKGKSRVLDHLRRIKNLIKHNYNDCNHPVTTISDAAQHIGGKKNVCKLDCS